MKPTIKANMGNTYHTDGTISYWSVINLMWKRKRGDLIPDSELITMSEAERRRIRQHCATYLGVVGR